MVPARPAGRADRRRRRDLVSAHTNNETFANPSYGYPVMRSGPCDGPNCTMLTRIVSRLSRTARAARVTGSQSGTRLASLGSGRTGSANHGGSRHCQARLRGVRRCYVPDQLCAKARRIHLVMDNLNTHFRKCFVEVLGVKEAQTENAGRTRRFLSMHQTEISRAIRYARSPGPVSRGGPRCRPCRLAPPRSHRTRPCARACPSASRQPSPSARW